MGKRRVSFEKSSLCSTMFCRACKLWHHFANILRQPGKAHVSEINLTRRFFFDKDACRASFDIRISRCGELYLICRLAIEEVSRNTLPPPSSPPKNSHKNVTKNMFITPKIAGMRLHEVPHLGNIGGNGLKLGSSQLLCMPSCSVCPAVVISIYV